MKLCFDSIEEVKAFVGELKGTRSGGKRGDKEDAEAGTQAPAPMQPPQGQAGFPGAGASGFAPPVGGATQGGGAFPVAGAPVLAPEVQGLVTRINARIDGAVAGGQPAEAVLQWFRGQCGAEAANASMDQIKGSFLPKMAVPALENIAKLMNA